MNIIERVKNSLLNPKTEWEVINGETATPTSLLTTYVLPLAIIGSLGGLLKGLFVSDTLLGCILYAALGLTAINIFS